MAIIQANKKVTAALLKDADYREAMGLNAFYVNGKAGNIWSWQNKAIGLEYLKDVASDVKEAVVKNTDELEGLHNQYKTAANKYNAETTNGEVKKEMIIARAKYNAAAYSINGRSTDDTKSIITGLAAYFKAAAWTYEDGGWKPTKAVLENAILYAILVVQSVTLLIAYIKRLFYIIVLALMAPIVVVYDFAKKLM